MSFRKTHSSSWLSTANMSYPFLHSGLVPANEGSPLNPIASVWLKTSTINICSIAPVIPLIRGWYLSIAKSQITVPIAERRYYTAFDAAWRSGGGMQMFRGALPLFASIPVVTGCSLFSMLHLVMFIENPKDYSCLAIAGGSLLAQELIVSPLRSYHVLSSTWGALNPTEAHLRPQLTLRSAFLPIRYFLPASLLAMAYPSLFPVTPRSQADPFRLPLIGIYGANLYTLYERGFRDILKQNSQIRNLNFGPSASALPLSTRALTFAGSMLSLLFIRSTCTVLATAMSNKHELLPF